MAECSEQMGRRTRTSALPIRDIRLIVYLLPMWGGIWSGVVFLWRRLICPQNSSWRMFWYRDLNSSHDLAMFWARESLKRIGHRILLLLSSIRMKSFVNATGCLFVRQDNESRVFGLSPIVWIVSIGAANEELRFFTILCQNMVRTWHSNSFLRLIGRLYGISVRVQCYFPCVYRRNGHFHSGFAVDKSRPLQSNKLLPRIDAHCTVGLPIAGRIGAGRGTGEVAHQAQRRETTHHRRPMVTMESK